MKKAMKRDLKDEKNRPDDEHLESLRIERERQQ